jgi:hypothetical protein
MKRPAAELSHRETSSFASPPRGGFAVYSRFDVWGDSAPRRSSLNALDPRQTHVQSHLASGELDGHFGPSRSFETLPTALPAPPERLVAADREVRNGEARNRTEDATIFRRF